ncbi:hypothetical protein Agsp01_12210 [Agromyces sp. NBRC 114283]|nr:hypothetical protein Agsp01_12210 [Agromyces sp. NBRC 114283]
MKMTSAKAWVSAIFAGLSAGLASLAVVLVGDMTLADLTQGQWLAVAIAVVSAFGGAFGLTYSVTNKAAAPPRVTLTANVAEYVRADGVVGQVPPST